MIRASIKLAEDDMALAKVVSYVLYSFDPASKILMAQLVKEVQIPLDETAGEHVGKVLVARQETSKEGAKVIHDVDACKFFDFIGEYNVIGSLLDIREENND